MKLVWSLNSTAPSTSPLKASPTTKPRTAAIETVGVEVLRFTNRDIDSDFKAVCTKIDAVVRERLDHKKEE